MTPPHATLLGAFGDGVRAAIASVADRSESLAETERAAISNASPIRVNEFSTGRWLARRLLEDLGEKPRSIPVGPERAPVWPAGVVGSISHGGGFCAVVVAKRSAFSSLGVDIEPHGSVEPVLWEQICTDNEFRWLHSHNVADELGTVLFSAKESVYKAVHPLIGTFLEFRDVEIEIDRGCQTFTCEVLHPAGSTLGTLSGHYRELPHGVVTVLGVAAAN